MTKTGCFFKLLKNKFTLVSTECLNTLPSSSFKVVKRKSYIFYFKCLDPFENEGNKNTLYFCFNLGI